MAPTIETIKARFEPEIRKIETEQKRLDKEHQRRVDLYNQEEGIRKLIKGFSDMIEQEFKETNRLSNSETSYERSLTSLNTTFTKIENKFRPEDGHFLEAFKLSQAENDTNLFYLGFVYKLKDFKREYPVLCKEYIYKGQENQDVKFWKGVSCIEEWNPEDGDVQILSKETILGDGSPSYNEYILLAVPFSGESSIGRAVKEIRDNSSHLN